MFIGAVGDLGYLYTGGSFTFINVPGAGQTIANGINDTGQIVGTFFAPGIMSHGFVDTGGIFTPIDVPGTFGTTQAFGINDSGQIVGFFQDATGQEHGFLAIPATVPEPRSSLTLATGLVALSAIAWCRKKRASAGNRSPN